MKIKFSLTTDEGEIYVGETQLQKVEPGKEIDIVIPEDNPMKILANACGVTIEKLKHVIEYNNDEFVFIGNFDNDDLNKKRTMISHCILTAWIKGKGIEWVSNSVLTEALRKVGLSVKNMHRSIDTKGGVFRTEGQKAGLKYTLTTPGLRKGLELLKAEVERM